MKSLAICFLLALAQQSAVAASSSPSDVVQGILAQQAGAWNAGDLEKFVSFYADRCTLVGNTITETTRAEVLHHYQAKYPSEAARGTLAFSGLTVRPISKEVVVVTGHWHLDRPSAGGGPVGGVFSLVFESMNGTWRIILDHTS